MKMIRLALLFSVCIFHTFEASAQAQSVSDVRFDAIGDSSVRVVFNVTGDFNTFRIRYGTSDTASGSGGYLQLNGTSSGTYSHFDMVGNLSGLAPGTLYYVSPEVSTNGTTWSNGVSASFRTLPRTQTLPIPPVPVSTVFPTQTGTVRNVAADCSNLQTQLNAAQPGDTVVVPAQTVCAAPNGYTLPNAPGMKTFTAANVRTSDATLTINGHGFTENQEVRMSAGPANQNCLPGMLLIAYGLSCDYGAPGWRKGERYWVHVPDASHVQILDGPNGNPVIPGWLTFTCAAGNDTVTFKPVWQTPRGITVPGNGAVLANTVVQFHSTGTLCGGLALNTNYYLLTACPSSGHVACTTQLSRTASGTAVDITSAGTGVHKFVDQGAGAMYIAPAPDPNGPWIVLTSGGALPQPDVRTTPGFDNQGFHIRQNTPSFRAPMFQTGTMTHNWRIVGAIFDTPKGNDYQTTTDPRGYCGIMTISQDSENILFDRTRVQGPGYPNRFGCSTAIAFNGRNVGIINSDWRGMDYWHPWSTGFAGTFTSSTVTLAPGTAYAGASIFNKTTTSNTVITVASGGVATGTAYVYLAMDGSMKVLPPLGANMTCTTAGVACTVLPGVSSPNWPVNAQSRTAGFKLATFTLASGVVMGVCGGGCTDSYSAAEATEGSQAIIAGTGPGPYIIDNSFFSGTGITLHFDDSAGPFQARTDYTLTRNTFDVPATQLPGGPQSDGLRYGHRQPLEWKGGQRIRVEGNIFQGSYSDVTPSCVTIAVTPRSGGYTTDFDFVNNTVMGCGGVNLPVPIDAGGPVSRPAQRARAKNNLFLLNGPTFSVRGAGAPRGWTFQAGYASEDVLIDHNTVFDPRGSAPAFLYWTQSPVSGMKITNNILFYTGNMQAIRGENVSPGCGGLSDKALMDCAFTSGPGHPDYVFSNNVIVPSWTDSTNPTSTIPRFTVTDAFPSSLKNVVPNGNSMTAILGNIKFAKANATGTYQDLDLRLAAQSPYLATSLDGTQAGANMELLQQAQARILQLRALNVTSTTATLAAFVPETGAKCYVGYGTNEAAGTWTWTPADTTASRERNFAITGLTPGTRYFYSMVCAHTAMPSVEMLRTQ